MQSHSVSVSSFAWSSSFLRRLQVLIAVSLTGPGQVTAVWGQHDDLPHVELQMNAPILLPTPDGNHVVCVQGVSPRIRWRDEFTGQGMIRVQVVDLKSLKVTASRDFPMGSEQMSMCFAAGSDMVYIADNIAHKIRTMSLAELKDVREVPMTAEKVWELVVVGDKLLSSADDQIRLDLPALTPTKKWAKQGVTGGIFPVEGGWHIDGLILDHKLDRVRMIVDAPIGRKTGHFSLQSHGQVAELEKSGEKEVNAVSATDYPISVHVMAPDPLVPGAEVPIRVAVKHIGHDVVAETVAGKLPADCVRVRDQSSGGNGRPSWNSERYWDGGNPLEFRSSRNQRNIHDVIPLTLVGSRVLLVIDGRLIVWDLDPALLKGLPEVFRIDLEQPKLILDYGKSTVLEAPARGGIPPLTTQVRSGYHDKNQPRLGLDPQAAIKRLGVGPLLNSSQIGFDSQASLDKYVQSAEAFWMKVLGRPPHGIPMAQQVIFSATDSSQPPQKIEHRCFVLYEIPEVDYKPYFDPIFAADKKKSDAENQRALEQQAANQRVRDQQNAIENRKAVLESFGPLTQIVGAIIAFIPVLLMAAPVWWFLLSTRSWPLKTRRSFGVYTALVGLVPLFLLFALSTVFTFPKTAPGETGIADFLVANTLFFMALMMITGSIDLAACKGYSLLPGIIAGFFSPLGLLVLLILPDREVEPEPVEVVVAPRKKRKRPQPPNLDVD